MSAGPPKPSRPFNVRDSVCKSVSENCSVRASRRVIVAIKGTSQPSTMRCGRHVHQDQKACKPDRTASQDPFCSREPQDFVLCPFIDRLSTICW
jgi:hypothetical protein